ncbi:hypothetical protein IID22_03345 [Patescibacteria group bacterium]|nr:hypothetical protein [Patescibacteria group bacterium]
MRERVEVELNIFKEREKELETGVVKYFERSPKQFGEIYPDSGGELLFFHLSNYSGFRPGISIPQWAEESETRPLTMDDMPATGIKVVFEREQTRLGIRASPWGFKDGLDNMASQMKTLPLYRIYSEKMRQTVWLSRDENDPVVIRLVGGVFERLEEDKWVPSSDPRKK